MENSNPQTLFPENGRELQGRKRLASEDPDFFDTKRIKIVQRESPEPTSQSIAKPFRVPFPDKV